MFLQYFLKKENKQKIYSDEVYIKIVDLSRDLLNNNDFFTIKNYRSSFEIISIITIFYLKNFKELKIKDYDKVNEHIINNLVKDLDNSLRENGIGDMSIGKYVKSYVKKFYYRLSKLDIILNDLNNYDFHKYLEELQIIKQDKTHNVLIKLMHIYKEIHNSLSVNKNLLNY